MIADIQDSIGGGVGNQVIYEDAFDGLYADLRYTYTKGGFVQDVIVKEQLPDPVELGFDPQTVELQVLTEFVDNPPKLERLGDRLLSESPTNKTETATSGRYENDTQLRLGSMIMQQGHAFDTRDNRPVDRAAVRKSIQEFEGNRNILLETVDFRAMQPQLQRLPEYSKPTASLLQKKT